MDTTEPNDDLQLNLSTVKENFPAEQAKPSKKKNHRTRNIIMIVLMLLVVYLTFGIFVIQPINALPEGATVVYFRFGLSMPFISSVDCILKKTNADITLFGRIIAFGAITEKIIPRKIISLPYSKTLYLISTGGVEYEFKGMETDEDE